MSLFHSKPDPIGDRAKTLKSEIARLESQIQDLNANLAQTKAQPRLRSTAKPNPTPSTSGTALSPEPVFEHVDRRPLVDPPGSSPTPAERNELGVRKPTWLGRWRQWTSVFRAPTPSNPKLLNLLAAGNIQGLRPLRYEKRVARNRFIVLVVLFFLVLWGTISFFLRLR